MATIHMFTDDVSLIGVQHHRADQLLDGADVFGLHFYFHKSIWKGIY